MQHFGERIKKLRSDTHITQVNLAEHLSVSFQAVSKWERNESLPDIALIPAIAHFFGVSADYLLGISANGQKEQKKKLSNGRSKPLSRKKRL